MEMNNKSHGQMLRSNRILIIDDNAAIHEDIKKILLHVDDEISAQLGELEKELFETEPDDDFEELDYVIDDAYQGEEGIEMVEDAANEGYAYSLAFVDIRMPPGIDGIETIQKIWEKYPYIETVICTAYSDYSWEEIIKKLGRSDKLMFLRKPFDPVGLKQTALMMTSKWQLQQSSLNFIESLRRANQQNRLLLTSIRSVLIGVGIDDLVTHWNSAAEETFGLAAREVLEVPFAQVNIRWDWTEILSIISESLEGDKPTRLHEVHYKTTDDKDGFLEVTLNPIIAYNNKRSGFLLLANDITEKRMLQQQLVQSQKLESIGQLAAGIAHEINTPIQYVGDNTRFLEDSFRDINSILTKTRNCVREFQADQLKDEDLIALEKAMQKADLEYILEEVPQAIEQSLQGLERVADIVRAMKAFSHPGSEEKTMVNMNEAIQNTITVARNEWRYVAEVETDFDESLPFVPCFPGDLNQVILNLIVNASHAIEEANDTQSQKGKITVVTRQMQGNLNIRIKDTGVGIPKENISKIFDPFFTTKEVGKGTGQGLSISHAVIEKHGGTIDVESEPGEGTTFVISLPLKP